ncbi:zona pellucida sperm-binding protein 4-like [Dendropsophus ebraccatus]|uniref:zona pellucida sperm-binding protein 4-like n=1 Tax=Dendropsophus ebraccatus TaxID=150705 RepID=UPI003831D0DB
MANNFHCLDTYNLAPLIVEPSLVGFSDFEGAAQDLRDNSSCGLWVGHNLDGSMTIGAAYSGCYVREEHGDYVMTLIMEGIKDGLVEHHKKDLKCPSLQALDVPNPRDCAAIQRSDRLLCANSSVPRDVCEQLGCCFSPGDLSQCYYGNKLTTQCTDGQVLITLSKDLTRPSLILESASVLGVDSSSCLAMTTSKSPAFIKFQFPLSCGGSLASDDAIVYENTIQAAMDVGSSSTRDRTMRLTVRCSFSQTDNVPLQVEVLTLPPPLSVSASGPLTLEMRIARDEDYMSYYMDNEYPVTKFLQDPLYLEVQILRRTDQGLILMLDNCWATPSSDPTQQVQWPILLNGCPFAGDNYVTRQLVVGTPSPLESFRSHQQYLVVSTFTFVDPNDHNSLGGLVYFHCSASVCVPSATESCRTSCAQRKKRATKQSNEQITVSKGPINFIVPKTPSQTNGDLHLGTQASGDFWDDMQNETCDTGFVGAEKKDPVDGNLIDVEKNFPKGVKGSDPLSPTVTWLKSSAVGGGVLAVTVAVFGVWRCHRRRRPTIYSIIQRIPKNSKNVRRLSVKV